MSGRYTHTKFIKVSNNNNACKDFYIDITTMKDARLRIGSLKSQFKRWCEDDEDENYKPIYHYIQRDYSFYVVDRGSFNNYQEVKEYRNQLYRTQWDKLNNNNRIGFCKFLEQRI